MHNTNTLFRGVSSLIPYHMFASLTRKHKTDKYIRHFSTYTQFIILLFAQIRGKDSLRDIEISFNQRHNLLYHLGVKLPHGLKKSTLADTNARVTYLVYEELFYKLLERFNKLLVERPNFKFHNQLFALDSTFVELVISIFPWAKFRATKGAIKLHTLYNVRKQIPEVIVMTTGKIHDIAGMTDFSDPKLIGAIIVFDKGYWDIYRFNLLNGYGIWFVTRLKKRIRYEVVRGLNFKSPGVVSDEVIKLSSKQSLEAYSKHLRLVTYYDVEHDTTYEFITNIFHLSAGTIALIYKNRWNVELFFKWIKQNLVIKTFFGTTQNAVFSQVWVAMIYYLLLSYIRSQTRYSGSIRNLAEIINERLFDDCTILDILNPMSLTDTEPSEALQLDFFQD